MTKEEIKNYVIEHKECCKKLAEEYRQRYNEDNTDKLALNMFYHNVISYNDYESVLALIENRNSMIMCFSAPPVLTEETVEINLKRIAELEKENAELKEKLRLSDLENHYCLPWCSKLTKAKELLERFLGLGNLWNLDCKDYFPLRKEAEQFLNSEVEK